MTFSCQKIFQKNFFCLLTVLFMSYWGKFCGLLNISLALVACFPGLQHDFDPSFSFWWDECLSFILLMSTTKINWRKIRIFKKIWRRSKKQPYLNRKLGNRFLIILNFEFLLFLLKLLKNENIGKILEMKIFENFYGNFLDIEFLTQF